VDTVTPDGAPSPTAPLDQSPSLRVQGYFALTCIAVGMILFGVYGPNDIWTSLLVGAVAGGIAARPLLNFLFRAWNWIRTLRR
jgi:hypothetical protein